MLRSRSQKFIFVVSMVFLLLQVRCDANPQNAIRPEVTITPTEFIRLLETITEIPSPTTFTPDNNRLMTPTLTPNKARPTPTRTFPTLTEIPPSQTPTLPPTLTTAEQEEYIKGLIQADSGCEFPCWWEIIPGKTLWTATARFMESMGVKLSERSKPFGITVHETRGYGFSTYISSIYFAEKSNVVDYIIVETNGYQNISGFQGVWQTYSPHQVIQRYGKPSRVWLKSEYSYDTPLAGYELRLFYDQLGFLITYSGSIGPKKPIYHICPRFEGEYIREIRIYFQSANNKRPLEDLTYYKSNPQYFKLLVEAGITIDEFYDAFVQEEKPCFDVPGDIFP